MPAPTPRIRSCRMRLIPPLALWFVVASASMAWPAYGQRQRPLTVDDLFDLEQLGRVAVSPDGQWLAVVIARPRSTNQVFRDFPALNDADHSDIWLLRRRTGERRNITNGAVDGAGYWNPVWSPDSRRLAFLSTQGGDDVRPYVWDMPSDRVQRASERGVDIEAYGDDGWPNYGMLWRDSTTLICAMRSAGAPPARYGMRKTRSASLAQVEWAKAEAGREPTASVLEAGREIPDSERPQGALWAIDVTTGRKSELATGNFRRLLLSPSRTHLALIAETGRMPPRTGRIVPYEERAWDLWRTRLAILPLQKDSTIQWVDQVIDPLSSDGQLPHSWSADGSYLAVVGRRDRDDPSPSTVYVVAVGSKAVRRWNALSLKTVATTWSRGGRLLALARRTSPDNPASGGHRLDWWLIDLDRLDSARNLTAALSHPPDRLVPGLGRDMLVGVASGDLWSFNLRDSSVANLTASFEPEIAELVPPSTPGLPGRSVREVLVRAKGGQLFRIGNAGGRPRIRAYNGAPLTATVVANHPEHNLVVLTSAERTGTFLWAGDSSSAKRGPLLALNRQLSDIADARRVLIDYVGTDGNRLKAVVILPLHYQPDRRYPLITYVYGGLVLTDTILKGSSLLEKWFASSLNLHLLPAHGYAVLIPSIPLNAPGAVGDPYMDIPKGVMSAVDRVIELGIADPSRLGLMGHSYGGYSTYTLITYTSRFKAAVATAAPANLVSLYGSFSTPYRYDDFIHEDLFWPALSESGQLRMGYAPSADLWRYLRNSPLYYVDRVQTPIMIIQGDLDYVPLQQGEEFFTALYRAKRNARLVRYWGEGHVISSPANVRDMWRRVFAWFDQYLQPDG